MPEYMTVEQVAEYLGRTPTTIYRWLKNGVIPGTKPAGTWVINKVALDKQFGGESNV